MQKRMIKHLITLVLGVYFLLFLHPYRERKIKPTHATTPPTWVSVHPSGRLGNQLFIAASSHGIAKRRKSKLCIHFKDWVDKEIFKSVVWLVRECPDGVVFESLGENHKYAAHVSELESLYPTRSVMLNGYLQSHLYWRNYTIPFRLRHANWARVWIRQRKIKVGIHARRGDYLSSPDHMGKTPPPEYYATALALSNTSAENVLICSDSTDWVRRQPLFSGMHVSQGFSAGEDMALLSECEVLITSVGTFGWWAGYFKPRGTVFYYLKPDEDFQTGRVVPGDYFPANWVAIDDKSIRVSKH